MNPLYQQTRFLSSISELRHAPPDNGREVAFAGRSNAGKSSALNAITSQKSLARTSKIPGRTRLLNFFQVDEERRFVDLPGYGYAKVPAAVQRQWVKAMEDYLNKRKSLCGIFLIMDVRHPLTDYDRQMIQWCEHSGIPAHILLTKADKLAYGAAKSTLLKVRKALEGGRIPVTLQLFSATGRHGVEEAQGVLDEWMGVGVANRELMKKDSGVKGGNTPES